MLSRRSTKTPTVHRVETLVHRVEPAIHPIEAPVDRTEALIDDVEAFGRLPIHPSHS